MNDQRTIAAGSAFPTTQWSVVLDAAATEPARSASALEKLCSRYWFPVYAFVRRRVPDPHAAEDLTQGFFWFVMQNETFRRADPDKGRFRSFILASLKNFLLNEQARHRALKRGGGRVLVSLSETAAEEMYLASALDHATPEQYFERQWAVALVRRVLDQLRAEYLRRDQAVLFDWLQPSLTGGFESGATDQLAQRLGMTHGALKVALHRARRRFGELLRHEVAYTVTHPADVEAELRHLLAVIAE